MAERLSDAEILRCVADTARRVILPVLADGPVCDSVRALAGRAESGHDLASLAAELYDDILPAIDDRDEWARAATIQLIGLVRYGARRGPDPTGQRLAELAGALESIAANPLVAAHWSPGDNPEPSRVMTALAAALADAVGRKDAAADQVRSTLRPIAVRQLDDELAETGPLVDAFRGRLS